MHVQDMVPDFPIQAPIYERGVCQWARAVSQKIKSPPTLSPFLPWLSYFPSEEPAEDDMLLYKKGLKLVWTAWKGESVTFI